MQRFQDVSTGLVLKNKYIVKAMPKTKASGFENVKVGDVIEITLELEHRRGGDAGRINALYPRINGIQCSGILTIGKLIDKGMVLEEYIVDEKTS